MPSFSSRWRRGEMNAALGRYLSIDYGAKRVGLAISDPLGMIAFPAGFIARRAIFNCRRASRCARDRRVDTRTERRRGFIDCSDAFAATARHTGRIGSMRRFALVALMMLSVVACGTPKGAPVRVIVPKHSSFHAATDSLERAGIVRFPLVFRIFARVKGDDRRIKPGTYLFKRGTPWTDVLDALNGGHGLVNSITIPEGYSLQQIVPLLAQTLHVPVDSVNAAVTDTAQLARLDIPTKNLEGYLFPDTYA